MGPYGSKYTRISLNGGAGGDVSLPESATWTTAGAGQVLLNAGVNTIAVQSNWGYYFVDALLVTPSAPRAPHQVDSVLMNPGATDGAKALMKFLVGNYGKKYISGQQDPVSLAWVETNIGKTPAIIGLDLIEYSPSRVEHGSTSTAIEDAIAFDKRGGIVTFCWRESGEDSSLGIKYRADWAFLCRLECADGTLRCGGEGVVAWVLHRLQ